MHALEVKGVQSEQTKMECRENRKGRKAYRHAGHHALVCGLVLALEVVVAKSPRHGKAPTHALGGDKAPRVDNALRLGGVVWLVVDGLKDCLAIAAQDGSGGVSGCNVGRDKN